MANKVRRAHLTVQEAIADWRRQFPILNSPIRFGSALFVLSRLAGCQRFKSGIQIDEGCAYRHLLCSAVQFVEDGERAAVRRGWTAYYQERTRGDCLIIV